MVYQTGQRKNLKNAKISNLSNEPQNSLKSKQCGTQGNTAGEPLTGLLDS